jgi:hypothetical protein
MVVPGGEVRTGRADVAARVSPPGAAPGDRTGGKPPPARRTFTGHDDPHHPNRPENAKVQRTSFPIISSRVHTRSAVDPSMLFREFEQALLHLEDLPAG